MASWSCSASCHSAPNVPQCRAFKMINELRYVKMIQKKKLVDTGSIPGVFFAVDKSSGTTHLETSGASYEVCFGQCQATCWNQRGVAQQVWPVWPATARMRGHHCTTGLHLSFLHSLCKRRDSYSLRCLLIDNEYNAQKLLSSIVHVIQSKQDVLES